MGQQIPDDRNVINEYFDIGFQDRKKPSGLLRAYVDITDSTNVGNQEPCIPVFFDKAPPRTWRVFQPGESLHNGNNGAKLLMLLLTLAVESLCSSKSNNNTNSTQRLYR